MNKLFTKIVGAALGLTMAIGVGVAVASNSEAVPVHAGSYATTTSLAVNDTVVIGGSGYEMTSITTYGAVTAVSNNTPAGTFPLTVVSGSASGSFAFKTSSNTYLSWSSGNSLTTSETVNEASSWTIVNAATKLMLQNVGTVARHMSFNSSANPKRIAAYGNTGQNALVIWKYSATKVTSITLNKLSTTITVGDTETLSVSSVLPANADDKTYTWSSSNSSIASVSSSGVVTGVSAGSATIKATANDGSGVHGDCSVTVQSATAESITVTGSSSLYVGDSDITLTATPENFSPATYTWNSSNTGVATISGSGATATLHAVSKGTTVITASASGTGGTVTSNEFTVTIKKFSIALSSSEVSMKASKSTTVTVTPTDANGIVDVSAESNDTSVATVSVSGTTITINSGSVGGVSTTITVSAKDNGGASGYHTAVNQTISVEVTSGYTIGAQVTALPSEDTLVFLIANEGTTSARYVTSSINTTSTSDEDASLFYLSSNGVLQQFDLDTDTRGKYVYNGGGNTTISAGNDAANWAYGMDNNTYPGLLQLSGGRFLSIDANGVPKAYASNNLGSYVNIYAYLAVASTPTATLSGNSVTAFKGDSNDTSLTLTLANFIASGLTVSYMDAGEEEYAASSSIATVTCGHTTGDNTVIVAFGAIGSTTVKLTITRSSGTPFEKTFTVTVKEKPGSITINNTLEDGYLVIKNGTTAQEGYTELDVTAKQAAPDQSSDYTGLLKYTVTTGGDYVGVSASGRVYGKAAGTGTVRVYANDLTTVEAFIDVKVMNDYRNGVSSVTFNPNLKADAGDSLDISEVFATKIATTRFGSTDTIADEELKFSYAPSDYENAVPAASFIYACDEETPVGDSENQNVYVYCTLDSSWSSSFPITVTQTSNSVTGVAISNVSNHAKTITRTDSFQLTLAFTPSNATNKNVTYSLSNQSTGSTITVSQTGLVSAGTRAGSTARVTVTTEDGGFTDYVDVTVVIEEMDYTVREPLVESFDQVTEVSQIVDGDYLFVAKNSDTYYFYDSSTGADNNQTGTVSVSDGKIAVTNTLKTKTFAIAAMDGGYSFKNKASTSQYISASKVASSSNGTTKTDDAQANTIVASSNGAFTISSNGHYLQMNYNSGSPLFRYYKSSSATYPELLLFKLNSSGGDSTKNVDATLLNAVLDNFGAGKTYEWSDSCTTFDEDAWLDACIALTEITNYSSYKLNRAVGNIAGNEVEQFIAKYDIIIGKFGTTHDHLDRYAQGGINYGVRTGVSPLVNIIGENTNTVAIIVIISMVSVTAIGGYFFLRKRKEI